jgi:Leucine-rich repeat (LRR) protein
MLGTNTMNRNYMAALGIALVIAGALIALAFWGLRQPSANRSPVADNCMDKHEYTALADALAQRSTACILNLSNQGLTELPATIGWLKELKQLDVSHNQLTSLPAEVGWLKEMRLLDASHNQVTSLPLEVGWFRKMATINLSHNQLTELPSEIGWWQEIRAINLSNNKLRVLPADIGHFAKLEHLDLTHNEFTEQNLNAIKGQLPATARIAND